MRIGIVFALRQELDGLLRMLGDARAPVWFDGNAARWRTGSLDVTAVVSGVGGERCAAATASLLYDGIEGVVCAGFAGALSPRVSVGDVVVARRVAARWGLSEPVECHPALFASIPVGEVFGYRVMRGDLVTSDEVVRTAAEKRSAWEMTGALALDMESHAAAELCRRTSTPFAAIRCISDGANQDMPDRVEELLHARGLRRAAIVLGKPGLWPSLVRLRKQSQLAAHNLGDALGMVLLRLTLGKGA